MTRVARARVRRATQPFGWLTPGWHPDRIGTHSLGRLSGHLSRRRPSLASALALTVGSAAFLLAACAGPPQVLEISPARGATDVASSASISIRFDRPMDQASVASRFHLSPGVQGHVSWVGDRQLRFDHNPLRPDTRYQAVLEGGYRDQLEEVNSLRHSWPFTTEGPPVLSSTAPAGGDRGVDTSSYVTLGFSRAMNVESLGTAVSLAPAVAFRLRADPADPRRIVLAPETLLDAGVTYTVTVTDDALDVDGNHLQAGVAVSFTTGAAHGLQHWVGFVATPTSSTGVGAGVGVWIVNESGFPRQLIATSVSAYSWSSGGDRVLIRSGQGNWSDQSLSGAAVHLPFKGEWAAYLASGRGYAYLDAGVLSVALPGGGAGEVAGGVGDAAVAPDGRRIAFTTGGPGGYEIDAYDVDLHTRYRLQSETNSIDALAWSPDGQSIAYRVAAADPSKRQIRARFLRGGMATATVATGEVGTPVWEADSRHVALTARVATSSGILSKAFQFVAGNPPPAQLTAVSGIPASPDLSVDELSPSPDGHQFAFVSSSIGPPEVWLMNADGSGLTQVTRQGAGGFDYACSGVAWTPS